MFFLDAVPLSRLGAPVVCSDVLVMLKALDPVSSTSQCHESPEASTTREGGWPNLKEFYAGMAVITVLACVVLMRGGEPQHGIAAETIREPFVRDYRLSVLHQGVAPPDPVDGSGTGR